MLLRHAMLVLCLLASLAGTAAADHPVVSCPPEAQPPTPRQAREAASHARDRGFLWRIGKDGRVSYLYGTMHAAKMEWMFPGPLVSRALRDSRVMALEMDMLDPGIQRRMAEGMAKLKAMPLPEPLEHRLEKQLRAECIPLEQANRMIPEMRLAILSMAVGRRDGIDPAYALDVMLAGVGHAANMKVVSLETPEEQIGMLQMQDARDTVALVESDLDGIESGKARAMLNRIAKAWSESDHAHMEHYDEWCECLDTEAERKLMKRLLDERNPALAQRIDALHEEGKPVFAAVGSLHMFGPLGLPALMEQRGYRVERIDFGK